MIMFSRKHQFPRLYLRYGFPILIIDAPRQDDYVFYTFYIKVYNIIFDINKLQFMRHIDPFTYTQLLFIYCSHFVLILTACNKAFKFV